MLLFCLTIFKTIECIASDASQCPRTFGPNANFFFQLTITLPRCFRIKKGWSLSNPSEFGGKLKPHKIAILWCCSPIQPAISLSSEFCTGIWLKFGCHGTCQMRPHMEIMPKVSPFRLQFPLQTTVMMKSKNCF